MYNTFNMKFIAFALLGAFVSASTVNDLCPHDLEVECITDVNHGINML